MAFDRLIPSDLTKLIQAVAVLLRAEPDQRLSRLRLLKLLYIANREMLAKRGRPIISDQPKAMDHGPVLSYTYDLVKGTAWASGEWSRYFRGVGRDVSLVADPGVGKLTRREVEKLEEVSQRFAAVDDWKVADYSHGFEEWINNKPPKGSSKPIPLDDLLAATGQLHRKDELLRAAANEAAVDRLLASVQ